MTDLDKLLSGITESNRHGEFPMGQVEEIPDDILDILIADNRKQAIEAVKDGLPRCPNGDPKFPADIWNAARPIACSYDEAMAVAALILAERERATRVQIEKDAAIAHETVKPIMAGNFGLVHVAEIGRQIAEAIRSQLTGG